MSLPVALQLYSVRNEMEKDFEGTIRKVASLGYQGVEFAGLFDHTAQQVRDICADAGVEPVSAHVPLDEMLADPAGTFAKYREIGCRFIVVPYLPEERRPGFADFEKTLAEMASLGAECKKHGLTLLGVLPQDEAVYHCDCNGEPSAKLPENDPMKTALRGIMQTIGL